MESTNPICKQVSPLLSALHDGELHGEEFTLVDSHVKQCQRCNAELAGIVRVKEAVKSIAPVPPPKGLSASLDATIDRQFKVVPMRRKATWAAGAVAAVAVVAVGLHLAAGGGGSSAPTIANKSPDVTPTVTPSTNGTTSTASNPDSRPLAVPTRIAALPPVTTTPKHPSLIPPPVPTPTRVASSSTHETHSTKPTRTTDGGTQIASIASPSHAGSAETHYDSAGSASAADVSSTASSDEIAVADLPITTNSFNEAVGLSTDEDGLYDIKM